ncbi:protein TASOR-like, partial [Engraulis encrasicolus]|uniref:protein TASOR-like n=1 Tax=Engraulis encrasicolus TaxID=184585 RepID=UPI002FD5EDCF
MEETSCNGNRAVVLSQAPGTVPLKNFVIPRKKRAPGIVALEPCAKESRDYALIESTLKDLMLDVGQKACIWGDAKLVHNEDLLRQFAEKRSDMRSKGRHLRETEERFCFLVATGQETADIYHNGLRVAKSNQHSLGKPSHGVYLFKHVDVALKCPDFQPAVGKNMVVFKVLFGRVKKVTPSPLESGTQDPTVSFDCHMSKDSVSPRDTLPQQVIGSSVFLFDFNEKHELIPRPRQCLPYAVIPIVSMDSPALAVIPASPAELHPVVSSPANGPLDNLKAFVLAERRGKGDTAMVTFKHFSTHGPLVTDQMPREAAALPPPPPPPAAPPAASPPPPP